MLASLEPAWVLHRRPYGDGSLIVECFALESGRFSAVLRGAQRKHRGGSLAGQAQAFNPLLVKAIGRGELKTMRQIESAGSAIPLVGRALFSGLYINELLIRTLPRFDPYPRLFAHYGQLLPRLRSHDESQLRVFELALLEELGYELIFAHDADGELIDPRRHYHYRADNGFRVKPIDAQGSAVDDGAIDISGEVLMLLAQWRHAETELNPVQWRMLKQITRLALKRHLGDRPLRSRDLFNAFAQPMGASLDDNSDT